MLSWIGRTALELIGRGGLGYSFDPLVAESTDKLTESVKSFVFVFRVSTSSTRSYVRRTFILVLQPTTYYGP